MSNTVDKVIKIALDEVGYMEKSKKPITKTPKCLIPRRMGQAAKITRNTVGTCMNCIQR